MVDELQSLRSRNAHSPSRPWNLPLHGCQSLRLGSSSRTDESILSWSLVGRPIPTPYQHVGNNGHSFRTDKSLEIYSPFLCQDIYQQHNSGYINKQGGTHSPNLCVQVWKILLWCLKHHIVVRIRHIPGKFNVLADRLSRIDKVVKTEWAVDQFNFPNVQLSQSGSVCNMLQSQTATLCIPSSGQSSLRDRHIFHELELSCLRLSSNNAEYFCPEQDTPVSVQNSSESPSLSTTSLVLRGPTTTCLSSSSSSSLSKPIITNKRKVSTSKPPSSHSSCLGIIKQSIRDKNFSKNAGDFVCKSRRTSTQKVYDAKWIVYTCWCHRRNVNPVSAPLTVIADFLIYLFSEKKYKISTIKGYRSMISYTLKFKTGNRIGSNLSCQN